MNKDEKAGLWSERIRKFRSSGQTCRDWCTEHQIPILYSGMDSFEKYLNKYDVIYFDVQWFIEFE